MADNEYYWDPETEEYVPVDEWGSDDVTAGDVLGGLGDTGMAIARAAPQVIPEFARTAGNVLDWAQDYTAQQKAAGESLVPGIAVPAQGIPDFLLNTGIPESLRSWADTKSQEWAPSPENQPPEDSLAGMAARVTPGVGKYAAYGLTGPAGFIALSGLDAGAQKRAELEEAGASPTKQNLAGLGYGALNAAFMRYLAPLLTGHGKTLVGNTLKGAATMPLVGAPLRAGDWITNYMTDLPNEKGFWDSVLGGQEIGEDILSGGMFGPLGYAKDRLTRPRQVDPNQSVRDLEADILSQKPPEPPPPSEPPPPPERGVEGLIRSLGPNNILPSTTNDFLLRQYKPLQLTEYKELPAGQGFELGPSYEGRVEDIIRTVGPVKIIPKAEQLYREGMGEGEPLKLLPSGSTFELQGKARGDVMGDYMSALDTGGAKAPPEFSGYENVPNEIPVRQKYDALKGRLPKFEGMRQQKGWSRPIKAEKVIAEETFPEPARLENEPVAEPKTEQKVTQLPVPSRPEVLIDDAPVVEFPVDGIKLSKDIPNFKRGASEETGEIEPLTAGEYKRLPKNPVVVLERANGDNEIVTGRHRLGLARRLGEKTIPTQVVREADGFTVDMARALDAESNIRDGQGKPEDYANYFRYSKIPQGEAETRGLLRGRSQTMGYSIGTGAIQEVYDLYQNGQLTTERAAAIGRTAPGDTFLQLIGLTKAKEGADPVTIEHTMRAQALLRSGDLQKATTGVQQTIFGGNKDLAAAQELADKIGTRAAAHINDIQQNILALSSVRRPERAAQGGIKMEVADVLKEKARLESELAKWRHWDTNRELGARIKAELESGSPAPGERQASLPGAEFAKKAKRSRGERGSIVNPLGEMLDVFRAGKRRVEEALTREGSRDFGRAIGAVETVETKPSEQFLRGRMAGYDFGVGSDLISGYRKGLVFPSTLAEKFSTFKPTYEVGRKIFAKQDQLAFDAMERLAPYFSLKDTSKVDNLLEAARRTGIPPTPETVAKKLSPEDQSAYNAVRTFLDSDALDLMARGFVAQGRDPMKVTEVLDSLRNSNYFPFGRWGDLYIDVRDGKGETVDFRLFDNKQAYGKALSQIVKQYPKNSGFSIKRGELIKPPAEAYEDMPLNIGLNIPFDPSGKLPPRGFMRHLTTAKLTPGYSTDFRRALHDYVFQLTNWSSRAEGRQEFNAAREGIDPQKEPSLYGYASRYSDYVLSNPKELQLLRTAYANYYLGLNVKSAAVNLTQSITMTMTNMLRYVNNPLPIWAKAHRGAVRYLANKNAFEKSDPELHSALKTALQDGQISEQVRRELSGKARGGKESSVVSNAMILFDGAERLNRTGAFISAYEIARRQGMKQADRVTFAEKFVEETQFVYDRSNRPEWARGRKAALFVFRSFAGNMQRNFRNNLAPGRYKAAMATLLSLGAMGGALAIPIVKELEKTFEAAGGDPRRYMRRTFGNNWLTDIGFYGLLSPFGINISGPLSVSELAPDIERGITAAAGRLALGVAADWPQRIGKAKWLATEMDSPYRAAETLLPEALRSLSVAGRGMIEGWRSPDGRPLVKDPTTGEIITRALGFQPLRLSKAYEDKHSKQLLADKASNNENINLRIARAIFEKDREKLNSLLAGLANQKDLTTFIKPDKKAIKSYLAGMMGLGDYVDMKRLPKKARAEYLDIVKTMGD